MQATGKFNHRLKDRNGRVETLLWFNFRVNLFFKAVNEESELECNFSICPACVSDFVGIQVTAGWI